MKPILNIENLTKIYGNVPSQTNALNGITLQVMPGEFLGIMGSSGSGKSTLLNCIATVIQPTGGSIQVEGDTLQSLRGKALAEYRGKKVGYLFQNFELLDNLTGSMLQHESHLRQKMYCTGTKFDNYRHLSVYMKL